MDFARTLFKTVILFVVLSQSVWAVEVAEAETQPSLEAMLWVQQAEPQADAVVYDRTLATIYDQFSFAPIWRDYRAKDELETQINIISLAGISQDFEWRALLLRDLRNSGDWRAYDVFATDSLLALMSYIDQIPEHGKSWYFGTDITEQLLSLLKGAHYPLLRQPPRMHCMTLYLVCVPTHPSTVQWQKPL